MNEKVQPGKTPVQQDLLNGEKAGIKNPFSGKNSGYGKVIDGTFSSIHPVGSPIHDFHVSSHDYFKHLVLDPKFACVAAQTVVKTNQYAFCAYSDMTDPKVAEAVCHDLLQYNEEFDPGGPTKPLFKSFIAAFSGPPVTDQIQAASMLYTLLGNMHEEDVKYFFWAEGVSSDTNSEDFAYSLGNRPYFVPFLHPVTSSEARVSELNFVVFNSHAIFDILRSLGKFEALKKAIRARQDHVHPNLGDKGDVLEFPQYALVDANPEAQQEEQRVRRQVLSECPFHKGETQHE